MQSGHRSRAVSTLLNVLLVVSVGWSVGGCGAIHGGARARQPAVAPVRLALNEGAGRGSLVLLPVRVEGRELTFVLDTGATWTAVDTSVVPLLKPLPTTVPINGRDSKLHARMYEAPDLRIGGAPVRLPSPVIALDLSHFRAASGEPIMGVLGMDALRGSRLRIDFERREVTFLSDDERVRMKGDVALPLRYTPWEMPYVIVDMPTGRPAAFVLDTGANHAGSVTTALFHDLLRGGYASLKDALATRIEGHVQVRDARLKQPLRLAGVSHEALRFSEGLLNTFGLRVLSNYVVTFDFREDRLYLRPLVEVSAASERFRSGLALLRTDAGVRVHVVKAGSAGERAGIEEGDVILRVDERDVSSMPLWQVHAMLSSDHPLVLRRDGEVITVTMQLLDHRSVTD